MKCKNKRCDLETMHKGKCASLIGSTGLLTHWQELPGAINALESAINSNSGNPIDLLRTPATYVHAVCNQCVTKDTEIERLRNQLAAALKRVDEWTKISIEVGQNERKKAKRDRAA